MEDESCPESGIEDLVAHITKDKYLDLMQGKLSQLPDYTKFASRFKDVKEGESPYDNEMIRVLFLERKSEYTRRRTLTKKLGEYGKTREEIAEGLGIHIINCDSCFKRYVNFVQGKVAELIDAERKALENEGIYSVIEMSDEVIKRIDRQYLDLGIDFNNL